jgi:hypothetical protein
MNMSDGKFQMLKEAINEVTDEQENGAPRSNGGIVNYVANNPMKSALGVGALTALGYGGHKLYKWDKAIQGIKGNPGGIFSTAKMILQQPELFKKYYEKYPKKPMTEVLRTFYKKFPDPAAKPGLFTRLGRALKGT